MLTTLFGFSVIFFNIHLFGNTNQVEMSKEADAKFSIIKESFEKNYPQVPLVDHVTTTTVQANMEHCVSVLKEVTSYIEFLDDEESKKKHLFTNNEWMVDYEFEALWPVYELPDEKRGRLDTAKAITTLSITVWLSKIEHNRRKQITYYNVIHVFNDLGNGKVKILTTTKLYPLIQAPNRLVNDFFLAEKANVVRGVIAYANCHN